MVKEAGRNRRNPKVQETDTNKILAAFSARSLDLTADNRGWKVINA